MGFINNWIKNIQGKKLKYADPKILYLIEIFKQISWKGGFQIFANFSKHCFLNGREFDKTVPGLLPIRY